MLCPCRAYEPRFGTEDNPIQVPALLSERIIGVTDPEDDTLVIWGIIREVRLKLLCYIRILVSCTHPTGAAVRGLVQTAGDHA